MFSRIRKILNTHNIINVLIFSYAVMLMLPFIAGMISFGIGNNIIKSYVSDTATSSAKSFSDNFDEVILNFSHIQNQIYFDEQMKDLCDSINKTDDVFAMRNLSAKLKSLIYSNSNINEIAVFPFNSDYVILSGGFFEKNQYYEVYYSLEDKNKDNFKKTINSKDDSYFCLFPNRDTFSYSVNLPVEKGISPARVFVSYNCKNTFSYVLPKTDDFFVFSKDNLIIQSDNSKSDSNLSLISSMNSQSLTKYTKNNVFATKTESAVSNLTYFYITDLQKISTSQRGYIIINFAIFLITLLISIVLFRLFIEIQYKPINNIIKYIKSHINTNTDVYSFDFINNNISNIEKEIIQQKESYLDQNNLLLSMHLSQWLKYNKMPDNPQEVFTLSDSSFYTVVSVTFSSPESLFFEYNPQNIEQNTSIAKFIIENTVSEILENLSIEHKMIEFEDSVVAIIIFKKDSDYRKVLQDTFDSITKTTQKEFNLEPEYYCSSRNFTYETLYNAYNETLALINNKNRFENICNFYEDADFGVQNSTSKLSDNSKLLFKYVSAGNTALTVSTIEKMCASTENDLSASQHQFVLACLLSSINDALSDFASLNDADTHKFIQQYAPIDLIMTANDVKSQQQALIKYSIDACEYVNKRMQKPMSISEKAKTFINEHYSDSQLTSDLVANTIGLSRDYFLKLFKQQTGESMSDYLNKIRIERACEIIKSEKCVLGDVAERVGYTNVKTFTRAFIKHVGITPGKYSI